MYYLALMALLVVASPAADDKLPFAAEVAIEEFEKYQAEIAEKAAAAIDKKRSETIEKLEVEAAKLSRSSQPDAAAAVLKVAQDLKAQAEAEKKAAELASRRWTPLMEGESLPGGWAFPGEPDGGWKYTTGELEIQSLLKYATVLHEAPSGDIAVRLELKLDPNGKGEKEKQAGVAFLSGEDHIIGAIAQSPGVMLAYGKMAGAPILEIEKSVASQKRYSEIQVVRVGKRFMVFARGKLIHDIKLKTERVKSSIALLANNAKGGFRGVEYRLLDRDDRARLLDGKAVD